MPDAAMTEESLPPCEGPVPPPDGGRIPMAGSALSKLLTLFHPILRGCMGSFVIGTD
jgi:hypothetical protein